MKYLNSSLLGVFHGPHISVCIMAKRSLALSHFLENNNFVIFSSK